MSDHEDVNDENDVEDDEEQAEENGDENDSGGEQVYPEEVYTSFTGFGTVRDLLTVEGDEEIEEPQAKSVAAKIDRSAKPLPGKERIPQDFQKLREECLSEGKLFEDPVFPADDSSLFYSKKPVRRFVWMRPHELVSDPQFVVNEASRFDIQQGELGDCWLLAAMANLTINEALFKRVVPDDQSFTENYAGIFKFRFWQYGEWVDVVVDDRLPTYKGKLIYLQSHEKNEFWSALLEKAYAKLYGSYESLKGGTTAEAMEDFSGGVAEMYQLNKADTGTFQIMLKAFERSSLMSCAIEPNPNVVEEQTEVGLIKGHAYSITSVRLVNIKTPTKTGKLPMVRIRNPWGNEAEWNGAWSDKSAEWQFIPEEEKEAIGLTFAANGEFWMSFKDFAKHFTRLEIVHLSPDVYDDIHEKDDSKTKWEQHTFEGSWVRGASAGGCRNNLPKDPENAPKPLDLRFFKYNLSAATSPVFVNLREVCARFKLPPGTYCLIPSTFEPGMEGDFIIRVFSEKSNTMQENDEDLDYDDSKKQVNGQADAVKSEIDASSAMEDVFREISGGDSEVDWEELQKALNLLMKKEFEFDGFSKDTCRSMIAMLDVDRSGRLGFGEFKKLWTSVLILKNIFKQFDRDSSATLSTMELRAALGAAGYKLNYKVLNALVLRYGNKQGTISFDDYVICTVKLKSMIELFRQKDSFNTLSATFTLDEWIFRTLYS